MIAPQITNRMLISAYLIVGFPEFTLSRHRDQMDSSAQQDISFDVYHISYDLIKRLRNIAYGSTGVENVRKMIVSFIQYSNCFILWSQKDKLAKLGQYFESWHNSELAIEEIQDSDKYDEKQKTDCITVIKGTQHKIINMIKTINPEFDKKLLNIYHKINKDMSNTIDKAYWDQFGNKLLAGNIDALYSQLQEAIDDIKKLRPDSNQLHEKLDQQMEKFMNNEHNNENIINFIDYLVKLVVLLQSVNRSQESFEMWKGLRDSIKEGYMGDWRQFSPKMLEFLFVQISDLKDDIINFYTMMSLGINVMEL